MVPISQQSTVARVIDECSSAADVFMQLGIDPLRHAQESISDVCNACGLNAHTMMESLLDPVQPFVSNAHVDWLVAPLDELADHIVSFHHAYLRRQLRTLRLFAAKARHDRGPDYAALAQVCRILDEVEPELEEHLLHEEQVLFPKISQLVKASGSTRTPVERINDPVEIIHHDYEEAARQLGRLREVTGGFTMPSDAPAAYSSLMTALSNLEADLVRHNYLENGILFPRAIQLQSELMGS